MIAYEVRVKVASLDGDGWSSWYWSKHKAEQEVTRLRRVHKDSAGSINRVVLADMPLRALILRCLEHRGFVSSEGRIYEWEDQQP